MRLNEHLKARLRELAERDDDSVSGVAERLLEEGVRMDAHPGIVFRSGPAGRRPGLVAGPDVAEVIAFIQHLDATGEEAIRETARWLSLSERQVRTAVDYFTDFSEEIDEEIERRHREAEEARRRWERQQQLLA